MKHDTPDPFRVAEALIAHGHYREALEEIEDAIKQGDSRPTTLLALALCLIEIDEPSRAREVLGFVAEHIQTLPAVDAGPLKQAHGAILNLLPQPIWGGPTRFEHLGSSTQTVTIGR